MPGSARSDESYGCCCCSPDAEIWPVSGEESSWNRITTMADDAINWMGRIHKTDPEHPVCLHDVSGSPHALDHSMHLFDDGDEKLRGRSFEN
jgi:arylsulfatase